MAPEEGLFCKPEYRQFIVAYIFHFIYSVFCLSLTAVRISRSVYFYNFKCFTDPGLPKIWQLYSVPKIKQEYFHNNRYPTILSVVYITTFLCIVWICLTTSRSEDRTHPPQSAAMTRCTTFNACEYTAVHSCGQGPFSLFHISLYIHVYCR